MTEKGDKSRPFQIVPLGGGDGQVPDHWPECPAYLSKAQRARFSGLCRRLDDQGTLEGADVGDIEALTIAEDQLELVTETVNAGGRYVTAVKEGRPYQCPACKGSGVRPLPKSATAPPMEPARQATGRAPGRPCSICTSSQLVAIEQALTAGESLGAVAKRFGTAKTAVFRHKRDHLGKPARPVRVDPADRTCLFCGGRGGIQTKSQDLVFKHPGVADQAKLIALVATLSAKLGLDVTSRVKVKGKPLARKGPSALEQLAGRRGPRK